MNTKRAGEAGRRLDDDRHAEPPNPTTGPVCEVCGTVMYERHCKIVCPVCGYLRDCSDP